MLDRLLNHKPPFDVLYEDNHLLVIDKPAGVATMGVAEHVPSVLSMAKGYLREKYDKPGNVYLGIVSRLDAPVTGVLLLARTSKAAARLTEQFRKRDVKKLYWALVEGAVEARQGELHDWVRKDERHRRMHIASENTPGAKEARSTFRVLQAHKGLTLVEVEIQTGRKHQIRLQWSHQGHPVVGDRKYGAQRPFPKGIALHSQFVEFMHPVRREKVACTAPLPPSWAEIGPQDGNKNNECSEK